MKLASENAVQTKLPLYDLTIPCKCCLKDKIGFLSRILILLLQFMEIHVFYRYTYILIYRQMTSIQNGWENGSFYQYFSLYQISKSPFFRRRLLMKISSFSDKDFSISISTTVSAWMCVVTMGGTNNFRLQSEEQHSQLSVSKQLHINSLQVEVSAQPEQTQEYRNHLCCI